MQHGPEFNMVLYLSLILLSGALMRFICKIIKVPFTLGMLLLGVLSGLVLQSLGGEGGYLSFIHFSQTEPIISPGLIMFVFLPALVFEGAFALDPNIFRKSLGVISLLAGPGLILNTLLVATLLMYFTPDTWNWGWPLALTFGTLISATDPVAVTAILRELGLSKPLVTIIEGESLLNDGTSIVLFSVFLTILTSGVTDLTGAAVIFQALKVIFGGVLVGAALAWFFSAWLYRIVDDPLLEIILTILLGYFAMIIAEGILHVSGIMAVVIAGQWMAKVGKMRIGHEVSRFLHQFWGVLTYIINTLVFFLVGMIIASQLEHASAQDLGLVGLVYCGVMTVRFLVTFMFQFFLRSTGQKLSYAHTFVISWGGLRGAVSLALALILFHQESIPLEMRNQALLLTTGVVFLSIFINGSTVQTVLRILGLDKPTLPEQISDYLSQSIVLDKVHKKVINFTESPFLRAFSWSKIKEDFTEKQRELQGTISEVEEELKSGDALNREKGYWTQVLNIEKEAYWEIFRQGMIDEGAARILIHEVELKLLQDSTVTLEKTLVDIKESYASHFLRVLRQRTFLSSFLKGHNFDHIYQRYNLAYGQEVAAQMVLDKIESNKGIEPEIKDVLRYAYLQYQLESKSQLEEMRQILPKVTRAIETNMAEKIILVQEQREYDHMLHKGLIGERLAQSALQNVEKRMKYLKWSAKELPLAKPEDLMKEMSFFAKWPEEDRKHLAATAENVILAPGDILFSEGERGDCLYIIVQGAMKVVKTIDGIDEILAVRGGGDIFGEMALLTGEYRTATLQAATTNSLIKINRKDFMEVAETQPALYQEAWRAFANNSLDNYFRAHPDYLGMSEKVRKQWISKGNLEHLASGSQQPAPEDKGWAYVLSGAIEAEGTSHSFSDFVSLENGPTLTVKDESTVMWLPKLGFS